MAAPGMAKIMNVSAILKSILFSLTKEIEPLREVNIINAKEVAVAVLPGSSPKRDEKARSRIGTLSNPPPIPKVGDTEPLSNPASSNAMYVHH